MAKTRRRRPISLEKRVAELESLITSKSSDQLLKEYSSCKLKLESLDECITSGIILRFKQIGMNTARNCPNTFSISKSVIRQNHTHIN